MAFGPGKAPHSQGILWRHACVGSWVLGGPTAAVGLPRGQSRGHAKMRCNANALQLAPCRMGLRKGRARNRASGPDGGQGVYQNVRACWHSTPRQPVSVTRRGLARALSGPSATTCDEPGAQESPSLDSPTCWPRKIVEAHGGAGRSTAGVMPEVDGNKHRSG